MKKPAHYRVATLFLVLLMLVPVRDAVAGGPAFTRLFGVADDAQTSVLAPAGMTRLDSPSLVTQLIAGQSFAEFKVDESLTTTDGGNPRDSDPVFVPGVYYARPLGDDWRLGFGLNESPRVLRRLFCVSHVA